MPGRHPPLSLQAYRYLPHPGFMLHTAIACAPPGSKWLNPGDILIDSRGSIAFVQKVDEDGVWTISDEQNWERDWFSVLPAGLSPAQGGRYEAILRNTHLEPEPQKVINTVDPPAPKTYSNVTLNARR